MKRIEFSLLELTNHIIHPQAGIYKADIQKALRLERNYRSIADSELSLIDRIYWLIEECKAYSTFPFAGVARAAFIAVQFLNSMVHEGLLSASQKEQFFNSLQTVAKQMKHDSVALRSGGMSREKFLERYGHIRPGTYDILSPRYDNSGIFIDIYPLDGYLGNSNFLSWVQLLKIKVFGIMLRSYYSQRGDLTGIRERINRILKNILPNIITYENLLFKFERERKKYSKKADRVTFIDCSQMKEWMRWSALKTDIENNIQVDFEFIKIPIPRNYDAILKK